MDQGLAVVLGAVVALSGSSLIPWLREALASKSLERRARNTRMREAVIDLLAANAAQGAAMTLDDDDAFSVAYTDRSRAAARVLLEVEAAERSAVAELIDVASVGVKDTGPRVRAFQSVLSAWAGGDLAAAELVSTYRQQVEVNVQRAAGR